MKRRARPRRRAKAPATPQDQFTPEPGERLWVLDVPYGQPAPGARWNKSLGVTMYCGRSLPVELSGYRSRQYTFERFVEDTINSDRQPPEPARSMSPRTLQVEAARAIARHAAAGGPIFLLADDTGVGKTLSAVIGAKTAASLRKGTRILVVADRPAAITIPAWTSTIAAAGDGGLTWCVITWDRLAKAKKHSWDIIIGDECQAVRHQTTKRWAKWATLSGAARKTDRPYQILASATPGHSPLELGYLGAAFAHATGEDHREWNNDYTGQLRRHGFHFDKSEWTKNARARRADVKQINAWLTEGPAPATIHREAPWGPVPLSGMTVRLTPPQRAQYDQEWGEFREAMNLARRGKDIAKGRAAVLRFRQKAGLLRVQQTAEWVAAQVDAGRQVAVSVQYVETAADPLVDALTGLGMQVARIYGQGRFDPEHERLRFQTGVAPVVVFTVTASINLHANELLQDGQQATSTPRVGVFHQARYSGIQARQVCGRTHRDHQVSPWHVMYAEDTIEERVARLMIERFAAATDLVGGDTTLLSKIARLLGADWLPKDALDPE